MIGDGGGGRRIAECSRACTHPWVRNRCHWNHRWALQTLQSAVVTDDTQPVSSNDKLTLQLFEYPDINANSMNTPPTSLRDLYSTPPNAWSFVPSPPSNATTSTLAVNDSTSYQWSTRPAPNPLFDLSASLSGDDSGLDAKVLVQSLLASALLQYATTALSIPWDVGKTLLQVQWVPKDAGNVAPGAVLATDEYEEEEVSSICVFRCLCAIVRCCLMLGNCNAVGRPFLEWG